MFIDSELLTMLAKVKATNTAMTTILTPQMLRKGAWISYKSKKKFKTVQK